MTRRLHWWMPRLQFPEICFQLSGRMNSTGRIFEGTQVVTLEGVDLGRLESLFQPARMM